MRLRGLFMVAVLLLSAVFLAGQLPVHSYALSGGWAKKPVAADNVANELAKIRADWAKALYSKQLDQIVMLYAPDAVFISYGDRFAGRSAIRDLCKNAMATYTSNMTLHSIVTGHSGDLAYDSGDYREAVTTISDGTTKNLSGNYLMVFQRQADGHWLILEQVWTEAAPSSH
jgi:uncharacterized protein (TIGR02246 family)